MQPFISVCRFMFVVSLLGIMACSSSTRKYDVDGKVLYKGKELGNVVVTFHPKGGKGGDGINAIPSTGITAENGTFTLTTGTDVGVSAGDYAVTFVWLKEVSEGKEKKGMAMSSFKETTDGFNGIFADASKSKHIITIKPESTKLEPFNLE